MAAAQQRRQHTADPLLSGPAQLPFVEVQRPQEWSWLNNAAGRRRASGRTSRKTRQRQWRIACFVLGAILLVWIMIGLYFNYSRPLKSLLDSTTIIDPREKVSLILNDSSLPTTIAYDVPQIITSDNAKGPHKPLDLPPNSNDMSDAISDTEGASRILHHGPLLGGPILVRHTIESIQYSGATAKKMHGELGVTSDGTKLWKPKPKPLVQNMAEVLREGGGFNLMISDALPLDREIQDRRHRECKAQKYDLVKLPEASVIIVFYNEPFSTLMRSVHSVLNRTPPSLLKEIILVDDSSSNPPSRGQPFSLEQYCATLPKVRLLRNPARTGIVGARLLGIENAKADIFVMLDSHIEVQHQWIEPLVDRIREDRRRIIMPQVDGIDPKTFEFSGGGIGCTLGIIWNLMEHAFTPDRRNPARMNKKVTDAVQSPTMAGGLFAAHRGYFLDLGGYDIGMTYWGVENLELSFRLWQCGGILECSLCSRVYHIFRSGGHGYSIPDPNSLIRNKLRTMAIWMDEYADLVWNVLGRPVVDIGDISNRVELRRRLECKPFSYFLNDVWPESDVRNLTRDVPYMGRLRNIGSGLCLSSYTARPETEAVLRECTDSGSGMMFFRRSGRIMPVLNDEACLNKEGRFQWCQQFGMDSARWRVSATGQIVAEPDQDVYTEFVENARIITTSQKQCLAVDRHERRLISINCYGKERFQGGFMEQKDDDLDYQVWEWDTYQPPSVWTPPPSKS